MYYSNTDIRLEETPVPRIGKKEILMRIEASGICGSDIMEWYRIHKVPLVLGHEVAGVVAKVGGDVRGFKEGDRIVSTHHVPCNRCEYCLNGHHTVCETLRKTNFYPGGFAEFVRIPSINVLHGTFKIPKNVTWDEATFVEPLGCVIRGQRQARMGKGKRVLVVGSGIAGMLHVKVARLLKAKSVIATDIDSYRLRMAKKCGATAVIHAREDVAQNVRPINKGRLADLVILCAGAQCAIRQGLRSLERGGTALVFTAAQKDTCLPLATNDIFWRNETTIMSSYAAGGQDLKEALQLISRKRIIVKDMVTHRFPLKETQKGFALTCKPDKSMKVIIEPQK